MEDKDMTQKEFEERTGMKPAYEEFNHIHAIYLNTSMDKDEFCKDFKKHGNSKVISDLHARIVNNEIKLNEMNFLSTEMADFLIGKSRVYNDTDFRKMAVKLVGEKAVVTRTLEMDLQLWEEDIEYIKSKL